MNPDYPKIKLSGRMKKKIKKIARSWWRGRYGRPEFWEFPYPKELKK